MNIASCLAFVSGPDKLCMTSPPSTYVVSHGLPVSWTTGGTLKIVSSDNYTCQVQATADNGSGGAVVAIYGQYGAVSKSVMTSCSKGASGDEPKLDDYVKAFPNPVSGILNIEIDVAAHTLELQSKSIASVPSYEVRLLDVQAVVRHYTLTQGGTVQFNVANLPNGIYYLFVHDRISEPLIRQIVVEH